MKKLILLTLATTALIAISSNSFATTESCHIIGYVSADAKSSVIFNVVSDGKMTSAPITHPGDRTAIAIPCLRDTQIGATHVETKPVLAKAANQQPSYVGECRYKGGTISPDGDVSVVYPYDFNCR